MWNNSEKLKNGELFPHTTQYVLDLEDFQYMFSADDC